MDRDCENSIDKFKAQTMSEYSEKIRQKVEDGEISVKTRCASQINFGDELPKVRMTAKV